MATSPAPKVILVPLDDRPCCLQFVKRLCELRSIEVIAPPMDMLGGFSKAGDCQALWRWLSTQPTEFPAIISADMMLLGGLVNSRMFNHPILEDSEVWNDMTRLCQRPKTLLFSTITRLAPTQFHPSEAPHHARVVEDLVKLGQAFSDYASFLAATTADNTSQAQHKLAHLQQQLCIHTSLKELNEILARRRMKHILNERMLRAVKESTADNFILFGLDDSKTKGVNVLESLALQKQCQSCPKSLVSTGADELAQLLLARLLVPKQQVSIIWSDEHWKGRNTRYEDCVLHEVVKRQLAVANTEIVDNNSELAEKLLCIWCPPKKEQTDASSQQTEVYLSTINSTIKNRSHSTASKRYGSYNHCSATSKQVHSHRHSNPASDKKLHNIKSPTASEQGFVCNLSASATEYALTNKQDSHAPKHDDSTEHCTPDTTSSPSTDYTTLVVNCNNSVEQKRRAFVDRIKALLDSGHQVAIADVAFANGGDIALNDILMETGTFFRLSGFAGWNTTANSLGTALATLLVAVPALRSSAQMTTSEAEIANRQIATADERRCLCRFLAERLVDDTLYQSLFRKTVNARNIIDKTLVQEGDFWRGLEKSLSANINAFLRRWCRRLHYNRQDKVMLRSLIPLWNEPVSIKVRFPWKRSFEIEANVEFANEIEKQTIKRHILKMPKTKKRHK